LPERRGDVTLARPPTPIEVVRLRSRDLEKKLSRILKDGGRRGGVRGMAADKSPLK